MGILTEDRVEGAKLLVGLRRDSELANLGRHLLGLADRDSNGISLMGATHSFDGFWKRG